MAYKDPDAQRKYQREWKDRRRQEYLSDKSCVDCGSLDQLEIDHIDGSTKVDHKIWSWSEVRRLAELAKCVVRCRDCHITKTTATEQLQPSHGTTNMYSRHGCRCNSCREAKRIDNAKRTARKC